MYLPEQAELAKERFFRPDNLSALRELALRFTAEKVGKQVQEFRQARPGTPTWATTERIMVPCRSKPFVGATCPPYVSSGRSASQRLDCVER